MSNEICNYHIRDGYPCGRDATLSEIADYYGEVLSTLPRWISVKDRLPKEYELVLAADRSNRYWLDRILPNKFRSDRSSFVEKADYWMPLPALPGSEAEE